MRESKESNLLYLDVPGLSENRPSLLKGDRIFAKVYPGGSGDVPGAKEYEGVVHQVLEKAIGVGFSKELRSRSVMSRFHHSVTDVANAVKKC